MLYGLFQTELALPYLCFGLYWMSPLVIAILAARFVYNLLKKSGAYSDEPNTRWVIAFVVVIILTTFLYIVYNAVLPPFQFFSLLYSLAYSNELKNQQSPGVLLIYFLVSAIIKLSLGI